MSALSLDAINELLAGSRSRGEYDEELKKFIASGEAGIEVDLTSGTLAGKDAKNVATGFKNAQGRMNKDTGQPAIPGSHLVKVVLRTVKVGEGESATEEGHVFLINTDKLGGAQASTNDAAPQE